MHVRCDLHLRWRAVRRSIWFAAPELRLLRLAPRQAQRIPTPGRAQRTAAKPLGHLAAPPSPPLPASPRPTRWPATAKRRMHLRMSLPSGVAYMA